MKYLFGDCDFNTMYNTILVRPPPPLQLYLTAPPRCLVCAGHPAMATTRGMLGNLSSGYRINIPATGRTYSLTYN